VFFKKRGQTKMTKSKNFFFHYNRTTLIYFLIIVLIPSSLYGIYQGSLTMSFNHMKSIRGELETDFIMNIPSSDYENIYETIYNDIVKNSSQKGNLEIIQFLTGNLVIDINGTLVDIYFCNWSKISQIERYQSKFSFLSHINFDEFHHNHMIVSQNLTEKLKWEQNTLVSPTGISIFFNKSISLDNISISHIIEQDSLFYIIILSKIFFLFFCRIKKLSSW